MIWSASRITGCAARTAGRRVLRYLYVLLRREIDCVIMGSGNETSGNRQADHEEDEACER
ncbi:MAG: hypothetical protein GYA23_04235 [Methanomicrobiales archaeon]|nr:hypothetical protein [Methanomicrobiales archaeon]